VWAIQNKVQRKIAKELGWVLLRHVWTYEAAKKEASKYSSLSEWALYGSPSSYAWARTNKVQRKIAKELGWVMRHENWTYGPAKKEAAKYSSMPEWREKSSNSYEWAYRKKLHRKIAKELKWEIK
jgi:hypothetical protein